MASMRLVTMKPPKMLIDARISARKPKIMATTDPDASAPTPTARMAPTTMTDEMALVTLISGVWSAGVTFHTT